MKKELAPRVSLEVKDFGPWSVDAFTLSLVTHRFPTQADALEAIAGVLAKVESELAGICHSEDMLNRSELMDLSGTQWKVRDPSRTEAVMMLRLAPVLTDFRDLDERARFLDHMESIVLALGLESPTLLRLIDWAVGPLEKALRARLGSYEGSWIGPKMDGNRSRIVLYGELRAARQPLLRHYLDGSLPVRHLATFTALHAGETDERAYFMANMACGERFYTNSKTEPWVMDILRGLEADGWAKLGSAAPGMDYAIRSPRLASRIHLPEELRLI